MAFCNYEEIIVAKLGKFFCNFVRFYYAINTEKELEASNQRVAELERKVGQLTYEVDWMKKNLSKSSDPVGRRSLVDFSDQKINMSRQAELLSVNRSSLYRNPPKEKAMSSEDLYIMRRIDELHTDHPTWGYRTITRLTIKSQDPK